MNGKLSFSPADILLPKNGFSDWATIACDQFTSEPAYWEKAEKLTENVPSCLHITLPEVYLEKDGVKERIETINQTMRDYLANGTFTEYRDALVLVERTLADGRVRKGIVGKFALADYDYTAGSTPPIRPTEGTVLSRIPARVQIRKDAPLELPHVMILIDDRKKTVIESLDPAGFPVLYDFDLMLGGGHLKGYLIPEKEKKELLEKLSVLADNAGGLPFAVGDGNHSLATAKACAELIPGTASQYALAELVNIHDPSLDFEPIYRVLFGVDPDDLIPALQKAFPAKTGKKIEYCGSGIQGEVFTEGLETGALQDFLDAYLQAHPQVKIDYIHGEASLRSLASGKGAIGFLFRGITKEELFPYVLANGPLPRKTFSMGEAVDKRYYVEARRIRED